VDYLPYYAGDYYPYDTTLTSAGLYTRPAIGYRTNYYTNAQPDDNTRPIMFSRTITPRPIMCAGG